MGKKKRSNNVGFFDKQLRKQYLAFILGFSTVASLVLAILPLSEVVKIIIAVVIVGLIFITYFILWRRANRLGEKEFSINGVRFFVFCGDIFKSDGLAVIPCNDFFDTTLNDGVINRGSLHGQYLDKINSTSIEILALLDKGIIEDIVLKSYIVQTDVSRRFPDCKTTRYKLGAIFRNGDYLLTAFSRFNEHDNACLSFDEYVSCMLHFWNEVTRTCNGKSIYIPLMGSRYVRIENRGNLSKTQLLLWMLLTFRFSGIDLPSGVTINIVLDEETCHEIDFYHLAEDIRD